MSAQPSCALAWAQRSLSSAPAQRRQGSNAAAKILQRHRRAQGRGAARTTLTCTSSVPCPGPGGCSRSQGCISLGGGRGLVRWTRLPPAHLPTCTLTQRAPLPGPATWAPALPATHPAPASPRGGRGPTPLQAGNHTPLATFFQTRSAPAAHSLTSTSAFASMSSSPPSILSAIAPVSAVRLRHTCAHAVG